MTSGDHSICAVLTAVEGALLCSGVSCSGEVDFDAGVYTMAPVPVRRVFMNIPVAAGSWDAFAAYIAPPSMGSDVILAEVYQDDCASTMASTGRFTAGSHLEIVITGGAPDLGQP